MSDPKVCSDPTHQEDITAAVEELVLSKRNSPLPWRTYIVCSKGHKTMVSRPHDPPSGRVIVIEKVDV